jgi:hypothetical protein
VDAAGAIPEERRTLRALLPSLDADCAGQPIRSLRRALGEDFRAALDRRVGLRRLALRLRVHHAGAAAAIAACWVTAAGTRFGGSRGDGAGATVR